jgi:MFS family permease
MTQGRAHKILLLVALYLAQGLPYGFFTLALPVLARQAGMSLTAIGALSFLALPWALKFLWAPYVDERGSRRAWLLSLQLSSIAAALVLAHQDLDSSQLPLIVGAFAFNLLAATQDIVTDGLAVRMLDAHERGLANGVQVGAYRVGMIIGGLVLPLVFTRAGWTVTFVSMAALLSLTILPVLWLRTSPPGAAPTSRPGFAKLLLGWAQRLRTPGVPTFIVLILCYRYGDQLVTTLLGPFLTDAGYDLESIAVLKGGVGNATSLAGAALGGWLAFSAGRRTAVLGSGVAQAACFLLYILAGFDVGGVGMLYVATICEGVIGTMATVALFTLMMDASDPEHAGTDYTLYASVVVLVSTLGGVSAGAIADAFGYVAAFISGAVLSLVGCLVVVRALDRNPSPARVAEVWSQRR